MFIFTDLRAMQIKTFLRCHFSLSRLLKIKSWEIHHWQAFVQTGVLMPYCWVFRLEKLYQKHSLILKHYSTVCQPHSHWLTLTWILTFVLRDRSSIFEMRKLRHWSQFSGGKPGVTQTLLSTNMCFFPQSVFLSSCFYSFLQIRTEFPVCAQKSVN